MRPGLIVVWLVLSVAGPLFARQDEASLAEKRDQKLKSAFLKNAEWLTDYDEARRKAGEDGKAIFAYFTRSYAP